jgi:hypothetical protein
MSPIIPSSCAYMLTNGIFTFLFLDMLETSCLAYYQVLEFIDNANRFMFALSPTFGHKILNRTGNKHFKTFGKFYIYISISVFISPSAAPNCRLRNRIQNFPEFTFVVRQTNFFRFANISVLA